MDIYFALQSDSDGTPMTGQASNVTVYLSIDGAAFTASTNAAAEIGLGAYKVTLTSAEAEFQTLLYAPVCTGAQSNIYAKDADPAIPTASDNAQAVWGAQNKEVTIATAQADTFATAAALATVGDNVSAVKAKTDNLPASPAAVGSEMALTSAAVSAVQSGLATGTNVSNAQAAIINRGNEAWKTADVAGALLLYGAAQKSDVPSAADNAAAVNVGGVLTTYGAAKTSDVPTAEAIWSYPDRELTSEIVIGISAQNIKDITDSVWDAPDRTLTDLKPKPNGKNIVCTPTNVTNAYGVPRLENWTNETSGTTAFDEKIETYITLAKEKMATDLNDHINAAIDYIGADNITELCAWLTGYNLYKDDESTDTDSLPETRYNQYLEQIHRIMENI